MKFLIILAGIVTVFYSKIVLAQSGMPDWTKYVLVADALNDEQLKGSGPVRCKYKVMTNVYGKDLEYEARGNNFQEAKLRLILQCVKQRCKQVGEGLQRKVDEMNQQSDQDNKEFIRAWTEGDGSDSESRLKQLHEADRDQISQLTCKNSVPFAHFAIVSSCMYQPVDFPTDECY